MKDCYLFLLREGESISMIKLKIFTVFITIMMLSGCGAQTGESYNVTFESNYHDSVILQVEEGSLVDPPNLSKANYLLDGWYISFNEGQTYDEKWIFTSNPVERDLVLYAKWEPIEVTISFEPNNSSVIDSINGNVGEDLKLPSIERNGYTFLGWYENADLTNLFNNSVFPNQDLTLYAKWELNGYTVNLRGLSGGGSRSITKAFKADLSDLPVPDKEGYEFVGWYEDENLTNELSYTTMPSNNLTIFAKWDPIIYKVNYFLNSGVNHAENLRQFTVETGYFELLDPTREGYVFEGWYLDSEFVNKANNIDTSIAKNIDLYASWREKTNLEDYLKVVQPDPNYTAFNYFSQPEFFISHYIWSEQLLKNLDLLSQDAFSLFGRDFEKKTDDNMTLFISETRYASNRRAGGNFYVDGVNYLMSTRTGNNYYLITVSNDNGRQIVDFYYVDELTYSSSSHTDEEMKEKFIWYGAPMLRRTRIINGEYEFYYEQDMYGELNFYDLRTYQSNNEYNYFGIDKIPSNNHSVRFNKFVGDTVYTSVINDSEEQLGYFRVFHQSPNSERSREVVSFQRGVSYSQNGTRTNYERAMIYLDPFIGWDYIAGRMNGQYREYALELSNNTIYSTESLRDFSSIVGFEELVISLSARFGFDETKLDWYLENPNLVLYFPKPLSTHELTDMLVSTLEAMNLAPREMQDFNSAILEFSMKLSNIEYADFYNLSWGTYDLSNEGQLILQLHEDSLNVIKNPVLSGE